MKTHLPHGDRRILMRVKANVDLEDDVELVRINVK